MSARSGFNGAGRVGVPAAATVRGEAEAVELQDRVAGAVGGGNGNRDTALGEVDRPGRQQRSGQGHRPEPRHWHSRGNWRQDFETAEKWLRTHLGLRSYLPRRSEKGQGSGGEGRRGKANLGDTVAKIGGACKLWCCC